MLHISLRSTETFGMNKNNDVVSESGEQNPCKHTAALLSEESAEDATLSEPNICITQRANQFT